MGLKTLRLHFVGLLAVGRLGCVIDVPALDSQVLITAENGGKHSQSVTASANAIQVRGLGSLSNNWVQYGLGLGSHVDAFVGYGNAVIFGGSQSYAAIGSNIGLLRRSRTGLDLSFYNNTAIPMNRRRQASEVLLVSALIASRPVRLGGHSLTLYGGASRQTPIGKAPDSLFTPAMAVYNGVVGSSVPITRNMAILFEYNPGGSQRSGGIAVLYLFPRDAESADRKDRAPPWSQSFARENSR
jgi:hypothetical protein